MSKGFVDPVIANWLEEGPQAGPEAGLAHALAAVRDFDQRPVWRFPRRWLPEPVADIQVRVPSVALIGALLILLLLLLLMAASIGAGSHHPIPNYLQSAAGNLIAYSDGTRINLARVDGSSRRAISEQGGMARTPVFAPDGQHVAFVASASENATVGTLVVAATDGSAPPIDVSAGLGVVASDVPSLAWSPDSRVIAFAASRRGGTSRIFLVQRDGTGLAPASDESADADLPSWSPDGSRIAYRVKLPDGVHTALRSALTDGTDVQNVAQVIARDASLSRLFWSPNGLSYSYAFNPGYGAQTSALIDMGFGHSVAPWSNGIGGYADYGLPWSPDGRHLAVLTASDGVIVADSVTNTNGYHGELRRLGRVADCWVDWSPDGSALYGGSPDGCQSVAVIPLAEPNSAITLPGAASGTASWQPLP